MKKIIFPLLFLFIILQGCDNKNAENNTSDGKSLEDSTQNSKDIAAAKRARLLKASEEKAELRRIAKIEKAKVSLTYTDASGRIVYLKTEEAPYYMGGEGAMVEFLEANLVYPESAKQQNKEGVVFVDFVIDKNGNVREVVATDVVGEDVDLSLKEEAVRVVASMPGWNAGTQQGKPVDASFSIPIRFILN